MRKQLKPSIGVSWALCVGIVCGLALLAGCERPKPSAATLRALLTQHGGEPDAVRQRVALVGEGAVEPDWVGVSEPVGALEALALLDEARLLRVADVRVAGVYRLEDGQVSGAGCGALLSGDSATQEAVGKVPHEPQRALRLDLLAVSGSDAQRLEARLRAWMATCDVPEGGFVWVEATPNAPFLVAWWPDEQRLFVHPLLLSLVQQPAQALRTSESKLLFNIRDLDHCAADAVVYCGECSTGAADLACDVPFPDIASGWSCGDLVSEHRKSSYELVIKVAEYCDREVRAGLRPASDAQTCPQEVIDACLGCAEQAQEGPSARCLSPFPVAEPNLTCWALMDEPQTYEVFVHARKACLREITESRPALDYCLMYGLPDEAAYVGNDNGSACPRQLSQVLPSTLGQDDAYSPADGVFIERNVEYFCDTRTAACVKTRDDYPLRARFTAVEQCVADLQFYCQTCGRSNPGQCEPLFAESSPQQDCYALLSLQPHDAGLFGYCLARMENTALGLTTACINANSPCIDDRGMPQDLALLSVEGLSARYGAFFQTQSSNLCRQQVRACSTGQPIDPLPPPAALPPPPPDPACGE